MAIMPISVSDAAQFRALKLRTLELRLQATSERLTFRVAQPRSSQTPPLEFDLTPHQAMSLMRSLQAYQRRYRWPIPMIPVIERSGRP